MPGHTVDEFELHYWIDERPRSPVDVSKESSILNTLQEKSILVASRFIRFEISRMVTSARRKGERTSLLGIYGGMTRCFFVEEVAIDLILDFLRYIEQIHLGLLLVFDGLAIIHGSYCEFGQ